MKTKLLISSLFFIFLAVSCKDDAVQVIPNYIYDIPQTNLKTKAVVGCYYMYTLQMVTIPNVGTIPNPVWAQSIDSPTVAATLVLYDPIAHPAVMAAQTDSASKYGIDYFIFDWSESSTTRGATGFSTKLINVFAAQPKVVDNSLKMIFKWNASAKLNYTKLNNGIATVATALSDSVRLINPSDTTHNLAITATSRKLCDQVLTKFLDDAKYLDFTYLHKSYYYQIEGRPVLMFNYTPTNQFIDWAFAVDTLRKTIVKQSGINPYIIIDYPVSWSPPELNKSVLEKGDAVSIQNMKCNLYDRYLGYFSFMDMNWALWNSTLKTWGKDFLPAIWPAYYRKNETTPSAYYDLTRSPANYINYCNVAKRNIGSKNMVIINSWNDFKFGAALEPCKAFGSDYLKITKDQFSAK